MSRLYWRIFIAFWMVIVLTMVATVTVNTLISRDDVETSRLQALFASLDALAEQAQRTLDKEGEAGLREWLEQKQASLNVPMFIVDPDGNELRGQPLPRRFRRPPSEFRAEPELRRERRPGMRPNIRPGLGARSRVLTGPRGDYLFIAMGLDRPRAPGMLSPNARRVFPLMLVLVSGVACFWLARYLTRPIQVFRQTGQRITAGDLSARVGAPVNRRKDEFGALAKDFDRMAEQIQALLESKQRLLREVSHELRSPLARLQAATGLLRQQAGDADNPNLERIEQEAQTLNHMIGQILAFSRLESMERIAREAVDVTELIGEVVANARFEAQVLGRDVTLEAPETLAAELDPALLQSAVDNVVRNAVQHASQLTAVTLVALPDGIQITVTDDGPGAPEAHLDRLFEAFFTAAPSNSAHGQGAGIGLAIARRAVDLHGGRITARNRTDGSGLEVSITLPAV